MTSVDEALAHGANVIAWADEKDHGWIAAYATGASGAKLIAHQKVPASTKTETLARLRGPNLRVGSTDGGFVWILDEQGFALWSTEATLAEGTATTLQVRAVAIPTSQVAEVVTFVDRDDLGHRGIVLEMRDGTRALVVEEHDPAAIADPTYNQDNVLFDAAWARQLGSELAAWLRVPHRYQFVVGALTVPMALDAIGDAAARLAARCERETGDRPPVLEEPLRRASSARGDALLKVAPEGEGAGWSLVAVLHSKSGHTVSTQELVHGARDRVIAFLVASNASAEIQRVIEKLAATQVQQGWQ